MSIPPVLPPQVKRIEPVITFFQGQLNEVFEQTLGKFNELSPQWQEEYTRLQQFEIDVRVRGSDLQHVKVVAPGVKELQDEREGYLNRYWAFQRTCDRIGFFASIITRTMTFFSPQSRIYTEEQRLQSDQPEFYAEVKILEESCKRQFAQLNEILTKTNTLQGKMISLISSDTNNVNWALHRFCQIVDNEGKPLSITARTRNRLAWLTIPKPQNKTPSSSVTGAKPTDLTEAKAKKTENENSSQPVDPLSEKPLDPESSSPNSAQAKQGAQIVSPNPISEPSAGTDASVLAEVSKTAEETVSPTEIKSQTYTHLNSTTGVAIQGDPPSG